MYSVPVRAIEAQAYWTATSDNPKTGNIPQQWIGRDPAETLATCEGCPLLRKPGDPPLDGPECYAHRGAAKLAAGSVRRRAAKKPHLYSLEQALSRRMFSARAARFAAIGCVCGTKHTLSADLGTVHAAGLAALAYCHHAAQHPDLAGLVTASTDTVAEAHAALGSGFRKVALVVPHDMTKAQARQLGQQFGVRTLVCPADASTIKIEGRTQYRLTCNECRLCDGSAGPRTVILFLEKGRTPRLHQIQ